jgi:hypothetical protein
MGGMGGGTPIHIQRHLAKNIVNKQYNAVLRYFLVITNFLLLK